MLVVEGLTCRFGTKAAVDNASFSIEPGGFVGVIGRSGAGKSTLLRMINRLAQPAEGRILYNDVDITALRGKELRQWRARSAMIFQQFNLIGRLDVLTNVLMGRLATVSPVRALLKLWPDADKAIALAALEQFEIASLDPHNTKVVMNALQRINRDFGITVICNLHSLELARSYCDRLIGMAAGRIVFDGTAEQLTVSEARRLYGLESDPRVSVTVRPGVAAEEPALGVPAIA